jgi:putative membrane protein
LVDGITIYTSLASTIVGFMLLAMDRVDSDLQDRLKIGRMTFR